MYFNGTDVLNHGKKLLAEAHRAYNEAIEGGMDEDDAFWDALEGVTIDNLDCLAVIWAAGAVDDAIRCEEVREAIGQAICFG